jgi:hypothetical protein
MTCSADGEGLKTAVRFSCPAIASLRERLRATLNPESADTFAAVAQHTISRRHLESSELVRPSQPSPSQHAQAWYGKFRVLLLPLADTQFPKE